MLWYSLFTSLDYKLLLYSFYELFPKNKKLRFTWLVRFPRNQHVCDLRGPLSFDPIVNHFASDYFDDLLGS